MPNSASRTLDFKSFPSWIIWTLFIVLGIFSSRTNAQCSYVTVSNAKYQQTIDGKYQLYGYCNIYGVQYNVWRQIDYSYYYYYYTTNFITYLPFGYAVSNGTSVSGWAIGPTVCGVLVNVYAYNPVQFSEYDDPYDAPNNWYELSGYSSVPVNYTSNTSLSVKCYDYLSGWAIFGIVIGSICGLLLLLALVACICSHVKSKKNRTQTPNTTLPPNTVVYTTSNQHLYTPHRGAEADIVYASIVSPPVYSNNHPPPYTLDGYGNKVAEQQEQTAVNNNMAGNANIGFNY